MKKKLLFLSLIIFLFLPDLNFSQNINYDDKVVALTFDDGPSKYTKKIVDYLYKEGAYATFFIVGKNAEKQSDTLLYCSMKGNEIGNHTYNHTWLTKNNVNDVVDQITKTDELIYSITGDKTKLFRPSYGALHKSIKNKIDKKIVMWNVDSNDWKIKNFKAISNIVINKVKDGDIILMHDTYERSYNALKIIIPKLKSMGFKFITVSELYKLRDIKKLDNFFIN